MSTKTTAAIGTAQRYPRVSVVVATYERPDLLLRCVDALLAQTLPPEWFEVVVIDDGSRDAYTRHVLERLTLPVADETAGDRSLVRHDGVEDVRPDQMDDADTTRGEVRENPAGRVGIEELHADCARAGGARHSGPSSAATAAPRRDTVEPSTRRIFK